MTAPDHTVANGSASPQGEAASARPSLFRRLLSDGFTSWALATPVTLVLAFFLLAPIAMIVAVSFWGSTSFSIYPDFIWDNYEYLLGSPVTYKVFFTTLKFAFLTWIISLVIGFTVAYYLTFHIRTLTWQIALFLLCTIPFWTSNIIRMISWIPFLGRHGIANQTLMNLGITSEPLEWLLYSQFSVTLAFVHLYTLFMVVPIFNTMMRIDKSLIEAAYDAGANGIQILTNVIIPLCKPGMMIGSIFVITLVMGDFITVRFMSGSQIANVGRLISNDIALLAYPSAAATAVVLLITVLIMVAIMLRFVDIRKEL
ncbi:MAG: ABC transporter permease [Rhodobacteraceae bacterium]|nr:ABC transporter permease [Paracoccaceae bacterium]MAY43758.1 ABC transporter permease [Paracoccaceae bacterium]|tara:strand:+ start:86 stop:1024 length:939 start_codon:yes stop_codon:yes gene_type:complete